MKKIYLLAFTCLCAASVFSQNVGIGTNDPKAKLDINGSLALREGPALTLANGGASGSTNDNIVLPDITSGVKAGFYRIVGPTAPFSVYGIVPTAGADGQLVTLVNTTNNAMTIKNNASSVAANSFKTLTGSDMVSVAGSSSITIQYNKTESRWYVTGSQNYVVTTGSIATGDITTTNNAVTLTNNTGRLVGSSTLTVDVKNNELNQKGLVPGPTGGNGNQVWGTDNTGNPAWQKVNNNMLNSSSITVNNGTGVSVSGSPVSLGGSITVTNTAPDQTVVLNNGAGISATGTYPNFTIANTGDLSTTNEAQTLAGAGTNDINLTQAGGAGGGTITLQGTGATTVSRSGNTFTINSTNSGGTVTAVTASNGLNATGGATPDIKLGGTLATNTDVALNSKNLTFSGSGNVGVGNNAPQHQLSVGAASSDAQTVSIRGYSNLPGSWKGGGAFGYTAASVIMGELNGVAQMGGHSAALNAWATLSLNSGGGNVGVGTTTPAYKFDVTGDARATGNINAGTHLVIQYSDPYLRTDANNKHMVVSGGSGWTATGATMVLRGASASNNAHGLEMYTGDAERMRILSNGNMGVGTAAPGYKLDVNGTTGVNYLTVRAQDAGSEGGEIQLQGAGSNATLQLDNYVGNMRVHTLGTGKYFDVLGGSGVRATGAQFTGLGGGGTRMVTTDNSGNLGVQTIPGGVLPAGATGQTLYHNGTSWTATGNLANDGSTITLGNFTNADVDEWPKVQWLRVGTYDEGLIKGSSARGVWGRAGFGIHMNADKHFGFFSTGWDPLFDVEGGTGRAYIKGNTGIGVTNPGAKLDVAGNIRAISATNPTVSAGSTSIDAMLFDGGGNYRPAVIARGTYPHIELWSDVSNANHGPTLRFGGYDNGSSGAYKHWVIGTAGSNLYFLDIGYQANSGNPHEGISGYGGPTIMRLTNSGNVGIGNFGTFGALGRTTPDTRLEVASPAGNIATAVLHSSGGQAWGNVLTVATDGGADNPRINFSFRNKAKHWQIGGYNADTRFSIWEDGGDGVYGSGWGTERITVAAGGNVGVGINTPNAKLDVSTGADGIAMGQIHGDNTNTIQTYIDGQWANRASYAGGCCNPLLIQPDVGTVGIGITGPAAKLHVVGNSQTGSIIAAAGNSYQTDWPGGWGGGLAGWDLCIASMRYSGLSQRSDERLKKDIKSLENMNALEIVDRMRPVSYGYRDERIARKLHYGFIAQEIQKILPEIVEVGTDSMQTLGMSYIDLIPILTQAVKEQQLQINQLKGNTTQQVSIAPTTSQVDELKNENRLLYEELKALKARLEELEKKK